MTPSTSLTAKIQKALSYLKKLPPPIKSVPKISLLEIYFFLQTPRILYSFINGFLFFLPYSLFLSNCEKSNSTSSSSMEIVPFNTLIP